MEINRDVAYYTDLIERLLKTKQYDWARDTLEGIRGTMSHSNTVTLRQKEAIDHIITGKLRHDSASS